MKKTLALIMAFCLLLGTLAGCATSKKDNASAQGNNGSVQKDNASDTSSDGEVTELLLWHMEEVDTRVQRIQSVVDRFNAAHPNIHVTVGVQSWGDAYTEIPASIMSGNGPDLLAAIPDFGTVIYALGVAQDVSDIVAKLDEKYDFYDSTITPYTYTDGIFAIPTYGMGQVLWYRADLFEAAGLTAPTTFDELLDCAQKLTDKANGKYGIALPASLSMATDQVIYSFMASAGAQKIVDGEDNITFNNEGTVAAYDYYNKLLQYAPTDCDTYTWGEPQALLNTGTVAMAIEKGQYLSAFEAESGVSADNLGCVPMPVLNNSCESTSIYYSNGFMLLSDDAKKREATEVFFDYLFSEEAYGDFLNAEPGLFVPVTATGATYASWLNNEVLAKYPEQVKMMLEATSKGALFGFTDGVCMDIGNITGPNLLAQTLQNMTINGMTAEEAVKWGQEAMEAAVSK